MDYLHCSGPSYSRAVCLWWCSVFSMIELKNVLCSKLTGIAHSSHSLDPFLESHSNISFFSLLSLTNSLLSFKSFRHLTPFTPSSHSFTPRCPLTHSSHLIISFNLTPHSLTPVIRSFPSPLAPSFPLSHPSHSLLSLTPLPHSSPSSHSLTPRTHSSRSTLSHTALTLTPSFPSPPHSSLSVPRPPPEAPPLPS